MPPNGDLLFENSYEVLLLAVAPVAAIPYGRWQLIKKVFRERGGHDGNTRTDR